MHVKVVNMTVKGICSRVSNALSATEESLSVCQVLKCQFIEWLVIVHARLLKC